MRSGGSAVRRRLYFNHIPKTAGTSLRFWMRAHFDASEIAGPLHYDPAQPDLFERPGIEFVDGHHGNTVAFRPDLGGRAVTWLREPTAWIRSLYTYLIREHATLAAFYAEESNYARKPIWLNLSPTADFAEFLEQFASPGKIFHGYQTRWLADPEPPIDGSDEAAESLLGKARATTASYALVGVVDLMQPSVDLLADRLTWPPVRFRSRENAGGPEEATPFPAAELEAFRRGNPDFELHADARAAIQRDYARLGQELGLPSCEVDCDKLLPRLRERFVQRCSPSQFRALSQDPRIIMGDGWSQPFDTPQRGWWALPGQAFYSYAQLTADADWEIEMMVIFERLSFTAEGLRLFVNETSILLTLSIEKLETRGRRVTLSGCIPGSTIARSDGVTAIKWALTDGRFHRWLERGGKMDMKMVFATGGIRVTRIEAAEVG